MTADPLGILLQQQLANGDPEMAQLVQVLAQREEQLARDLEAREAEESARQEEARQAAERRDGADALRHLVDEMSSELDGLRRVLDEVAAALGACPSCWGDDPGCRWCRGRGHPGFMPPDRDAFDRLILPAVRTHVLVHRNPALAAATAQPHSAERGAS